MTRSNEHALGEADEKNTMCKKVNEHPFEGADKEYTTCQKKVKKR